MSQGLPENIKLLTNTTVKEILNRVKHLQNGDISRIMNKMGIRYKYNYGVSLPELRHIANKYQPNTNLALILFNQDIREAKILASILMPEDILCFKQAHEISKHIKNQELVEQFSRNVFSKLNCLIELLNNWVNENDWNKILAFYSIGWKFKISNADSEKYFSWFVKNCQKQADTNNTLLHQSIIFAMQSFANISEDNRDQVNILAEKMMQTEKKSVQRIAEEFLWLSV